MWIVEYRDRDFHVRARLHDSSWATVADRVGSRLVGKRRVFALSDCDHCVNADLHSSRADDRIRTCHFFCLTLHTEGRSKEVREVDMHDPPGNSRA